MDPYQALLELARLLLAEDGPEPAARTLLLCLLKAGEQHRLFRGELIEDLPEGLRRRLRETGQL